jgi:hypothetical protein
VESLPRLGPAARRIASAPAIRKRSASGEFVDIRGF